jgi:hypothetical protein
MQADGRGAPDGEEGRSRTSKLAWYRTITVIPDSQAALFDMSLNMWCSHSMVIASMCAAGITHSVG